MGNSEQLGPQAEDSGTGLTGLGAGSSSVGADQGCLDTADPWLEPSPASDTSASSSLRRGGTRAPAQQPRLQPPRALGHWCPRASQPWGSGMGVEDGRGRQREGPGTEGIPSVHTLPRVPSHALLMGIISVMSPFVNHHGSHPIQLPAAFSGGQPAPRAGPLLHKHHLTARLVLVVLALPCIYHPARRKNGVKALSFTSCPANTISQHLFPPPQPSTHVPMSPEMPGMSCTGAPVPSQLSQTSCVGRSQLGPGGSSCPHTYQGR